jgi:hypothetical protein
VTLFPAADCMQARQEGTLDDLVVSLQSRRELLKTLDLIPPQYTYEAARAAMQDAPRGGFEPAGSAALLSAGSQRQLLETSAQQQEPRLRPQVPQL